MHRQKRVWQQVAFEHALSTGLALFLTGLAAFFVLFGLDAKEGGIGLGSMLLLFLYVFGMGVVFRREIMKRRQREQELVMAGQVAVEPTQPSKRKGLRRASIGFAGATLVLLVAAPFLAGSANAIAEQAGISTTFIGTSLEGITTSLPELVTATGAIRRVPSPLQLATSSGATPSIWRPFSSWTSPMAAGLYSTPFRHPCHDGSVEHPSHEHRPNGHHLSC